jgi:hypothetical protein
MRQIIEKHCEHGIDLYFLFIDYQKAFDSINRNALIQTIEQLDIPKKLIELIKMTLNQTRAKVRIRNRMGEVFHYNMGVKQGDGLSTVLFNIALHGTISKIGKRGSIFTKSSQICAYADDVIIIARTEKDLKMSI